MNAARAFAGLAAAWTVLALAAWIAALLGAPIMVTLGDHVAGMIYGAFGSAVLALVHAPGASVRVPRWLLPVALPAQILMLVGGVAAAVATGVRLPALAAAAVGWLAVTIALGRNGALAVTALAAVAGLGGLLLGRLDVGAAFGVHAFLVPAVLILAERLDRGPGDVPRAGEVALVLLGLARAIARPIGVDLLTGVIDVVLALVLVVALADLGPWRPGPRSGALRVGLVWLILAYAGDALALGLGELVGSLPAHAALVGGVGSLLVAAAASAGEGRWSGRSAVALALVQVAAVLRVVPLVLGRPSAYAMVAATVALAVGLPIGLRLRPFGRPRPTDEAG